MTDLRARLTALREEMRELMRDADGSISKVTVGRWQIELDAILASLPAEQEPIEMPNLRQPLETSAAESWRVERDRQQTSSAAAPRRQQAETPACEHDIGEYGCPTCEPQAETPITDEQVTTFTPMMWATMSEDERYTEYIRVRKLAATPHEAPGHTALLTALLEKIESALTRLDKECYGVVDRSWAFDELLHLRRDIREALTIHGGN